MAKLQRYLQKIFANNSNQVGVFGTGVDKETSKNVETLQSADYENGWSSAVITNKNYPIWQERDGVDYGFSYQLAYLMQAGLPEWLSTETYYTNSFCRYGAKIYYSLQDNNINHNPALNDGYWEEFSSGASHNIGEIVQSTIPLTDAGLHLLDGALIQYGSYSAFVDYIADLYDSSTKYSNVTKIGSLTDNSGVLSGFSTSNYTKFPANFQPSTSPWEMVFKVRTGSDFTTQNTLASFQKGSTNETRYATRILITPDSKFGISVTYNGTAWDITSGTSGGTGSYTILPNTTYYLKFEFTGTAYKLSYSFDGETYTQDCYVASTTPMYNSCTYCVLGLWNNGSTLAPWTGSVDLNESYININGSRWWSGVNPSWATNEVQWQTAVTTYGSCDKYVYDSVNNTVRIPKRNSEHGDLIKSYKSGTDWYNIYADGWCEQGRQHSAFGQDSTNTVYLLKNFASTNYQVYQTSIQTGVTGNVRSGCCLGARSVDSFILYQDTYADNGGVWMACGYVDISDYQYSPIYEYLVIATSTKTDIEVDIDEIATDLNGKADVDLTNVNNQGKILMSRMGMPSSTYTDLTLGASGSTYTAPANGFVTISKKTNNTNQYLYIHGKLWIQGFANPSTYSLELFCPVNKGEQFTIEYTAGGAVERFRFYYAVGSESEAS